MGWITHRRRVPRAALFGATAVLVLGVAGGGVLGWPRSWAFRLILGIVVLFNLAWWIRADMRLAELRRERGRRGTGRRLLAVHSLLVLVPVVLMLVGVMHWEWIPTPAAMWAQLWHMTIVLLVPLGTIAGACCWLVRAARPGATGPEPEPDPSRRRLLQRAAVAAPVVIAAGGTGTGLWQIGRFQVNHRDVSPPGLPERLRGLTITHLSDFHVGRLFRIDHLRRVVDAANRLDGDIVVITGDVVDHSNDVLPATVEILQGLRHRYGMFLCVGNHDLLDDGAFYIEYCRSAGLPLLVNERRDLTIGGERIAVGGLMWARHQRERDPLAGHQACVDRTFGVSDGSPVDAFAIALAHHPHAFDAAALRGVSLTLSGHTHGGQLMLTPPGWPALGAGNLLFRYVRGFYAAGGNGCAARPMDVDGPHRSEQPILFVNAGAGNWFPVRIHAPAEIVRLRLV